MQYINPFALFGLETNTNESKIAAVKADIMTRLVQADVDTDMVSIRGQRFTKGEWQYWLDQLCTTEQRQIHIAIVENHALRNFLEFTHLGFFAAAPAPDFWQNAEFVAYIRPFFVFQYAEALLQALKTQNEADMQALQNSPFEISQAEYDTYFVEISDYLSLTAQDLKNLSENNSLTYLSERELVSHLPDTTINIYNYLPNSLSGVRNWIGDSVGRIAMYMSVQLGRPDGAIALVRQALKLKLDEALRLELEQLLQAHKSRSRTPLWILIGVGAMLLLFALKYVENRYF
jgi:hypothetical protein